MTRATRRSLLALALAVLPAAAIARAEPSDTLEVLVFPDGHVEVNGQRLDDAGLEARARAHVRAVGAASARASIAADRRVAYAQVIAVMDALRRGGIDQIAMQVAPEGS